MEKIPAIVNIPFKVNIFSYNRRWIWIVLPLVATIALLTMLQDYLQSSFARTTYYLSESFLFSTFWWIFIPILYLQISFIRKYPAKNLVYTAGIFVIPILLHLFLFPALIWVVSYFFYDHTYEYYQTLRFSLSEYLFSLLFFYTVPAGLYIYFTPKGHVPITSLALNQINTVAPFQTTLTVAEGSKRINIEVSNILYFSAYPPYITIYYNNKKYLYSDTLKSISTKINSADFMRIHKSTIINIRLVQSYTSRLNGDYDVTMRDGTELRLSRNYAASFKAAFHQSHPLTVK